MLAVNRTSRIRQIFNGLLQILRVISKTVPRRRIIDGLKQFSKLDIFMFATAVIYIINPFDLPGPLDDAVFTLL